MNHRCLFSLLLLLTITLQAASQAPGDRSPSCNTPEVTNTIKLLDSRDYENLTATFNLDQRWTSSGPPCMQELNACATTTDTAEFLTQSIVYDGVAPNAVEIGIEVNFMFSDSSASCPGELRLTFSTLSAPDSQTSSTITCDSASPQTVYFNVSSLDPFNTFNVTTRAVADMDGSYCVNITQLRVHVQQCPVTRNGLADYPLTVSGATEDGTCVVNSAPAVGSTLSATCGRDRGYNFSTAGECECIAGYGFFSNACEVCDDGYFMSGSGVCMMCPSGSTNTNPTGTSCQCMGSTTTAAGSSTTTLDPCGGNTCNNNLYFDTTSESCKMCQYQSNSSDPASESCDCNAGYVDGGAATTTTTGCTECAANYYQTSVTMPESFSVCDGCPANSQRVLGSTPGVCPCLSDDYMRSNPAASSSDCLATFGFTVETLTVTESTQGVLTIDLPGTSPAVSVSVQGNHADATVDTQSFSFDASRTETITVTLSDDDIALQPDRSFTLSLSVTSGPGMITAGRSSVDITLEDDDTVMVGFQSSTVSFDESDGSVRVFVEKSADIASPLTLTVSSTLGGIVVSQNVTFSTGPNNNRAEVTIDIPNNENDNDDVTFTLTLQQQDPSDARVIIGIAAPYDGTLEVTILDDDPPEPSDDGLATGAIIGIAVGAAGGAVLATCICLICVLVCRFRVNRQGYYATYEDKAAEPSMIRYSASLRSISSQTVIPAEGKPTTTPKENEFYV